MRLILHDTYRNRTGPKGFPITTTKKLRRLCLSATGNGEEQAQLSKLRLMRRFVYSKKEADPPYTLAFVRYPPRKNTRDLLGRRKMAIPSPLNS